MGSCWMHRLIPWRTQSLPFCHNGSRCSGFFFLFFICFLFVCFLLSTVSPLYLLYFRIPVSPVWKVSPTVSILPSGATPPSVILIWNFNVKLTLMFGSVARALSLTPKKQMQDNLGSHDRNKALTYIIPHTLGKGNLSKGMIIENRTSE